MLLTLSDKEDGHGLFDRLAEYLGVNLDKVPTVLYFGENAGKYLFDGESISAANLASFLGRVKAGEVKQFLKSAEIPESNEEPVKVLVGRTFEKTVLES